MGINWLRLIPGIIILALILAVIGLKAERDKWKANSAAQAEGRRADQESYRRAQAEAEAKNKATVQRIEAKQREITDNAETGYRRDLAELRRLRAQGRTAQGSAQGTGASGVPEAPGGADGAPDVRVSREDALRSAETELKLLYLQKWLREQATVNPNAPD